ncbi:hypothetical protein [Brucella intermedia]|nr:hypothetical protein [Brucella intermedia]
MNYDFGVKALLGLYADLDAVEGSDKQDIETCGFGVGGPSFR